MKEHEFAFGSIALERSTALKFIAFMALQSSIHQLCLMANASSVQMGTKLLGTDIRITARLLVKTLRGKTLSRSGILLYSNLPASSQDKHYKRPNRSILCLCFQIPDG